MKKIIYTVSIIAVLLCGCKGGSASGQQPTTSTENSMGSLQAFKLPEVPAILTTPEARADFVVKHYWDHFNFADTNYIHHPEITEQAWADYADVLNHVPLQTAQEAMKETIKRSEVSKTMFTYFTGLADKYLYDPNSPLRNEEFYIPVLEVMLQSPLLDKYEKVRPQHRLDLAQKNRLGTKALNFKYTTASGKQGSLYNLSADHIIVYINNPGCHACAEVTEQFKTSPVVDHLVKGKKLIILSIYPDEELEEWKKHQNDFPSTWINGYDKELAIRDNSLYDLKAIPSLYLLDKDKKVLLKDATAQQILQLLSRLSF